MHILKEQTLPQTLYIIPRSYPDKITLLIQDDVTKNETEDPVDVAMSNYYLGIPYAFDLKEGHFYTFIVKEFGTEEVIYLGRIFCTNQPIETYSINDGNYKARPHDNNYITRDNG